MSQQRAYQVNPGGNTRTHIHASVAEDTLLNIIAPELRKRDPWKSADPYLNRASKLDVHFNLGDNPSALVFNDKEHQATIQLAEKLEAALIMSGLLRRTGKPVYNGSVLYPPGEAAILVNREGREQLTNFIALLEQQKTSGCARA